MRLRLWRWGLKFLDILFVPFLVVEFNILSMFTASAVCFPHRG